MSMTGPFDSLREYVSALEARGLLLRIAEMDQDKYEATGFAYQLVKEFSYDLAPAFLIETIKINNQKKEYEIKGILKEANIKNIFTPNNSIKENFWFYINVNQMSEFTGLNLIDGVFLDLIESSPDEKFTAINSSIPKIINNHLQYAITWAMLGLIFLVMNYIYNKKNK